MTTWANIGQENIQTSFKHDETDEKLPVAHVSVGRISEGKKSEPFLKVVFREGQSDLQGRFYGMAQALTVRRDLPTKTKMGTHQVSQLGNTVIVQGELRLVANLINSAYIAGEAATQANKAAEHLMQPKGMRGALQRMGLAAG